MNDVVEQPKLDTEVIDSVQALEMAAKESGVNFKAVDVSNSTGANGQPVRAETDAELKDVLQMTFDVGGGAMSAWKGEHWVLQGEESEKLAEAWARWIDYRFGSVNASPDVAVIVSTAMIVGPRLLIDVLNAKQKEGNNDGEESTARPE